jgi:hypothetical protein
MPLATLQYSEGTIQSPQHTQSSETCFVETDNVHFPDGNLTNLPSYDLQTLLLDYGNIQGVCRAIFASASKASRANYLFATHSNLYALRADKTSNITPLKTVGATLGNNPLATVNAQKTLTITQSAHGLNVGDRIKLSGAITTGGVAINYLNNEHIVASVINANSVTIALDVVATSTATGGGAAVQIFKQIATGNPYQELASGWGYGLFGIGVLGVGGFSLSDQQYPRISSMDNFGSDILYCAGDYDAGDGQKIYSWNGDNNVAPTQLLNAPTDCQWVMTVNNCVVALCGSKIKISEYGDATAWSGQTYAEFEVQRSKLLISGFSVGDKEAIIFAPEPYLLRSINGIWDLVELGSDYPIIAPRACCQFNDGLIWYCDDGNFYFYGGGSVERIVNAQNGEYIRRNINKNAIWTCFMMHDQKHDQAWLFFPTGASKNPNEQVIINLRHYKGSVAPSFTLGELGRTAAQLPSIIDNVFYMANENIVYSHFIRGSSNKPWKAKTAYFYFDKQTRAKLMRIIPDIFRNGDITCKVWGRENPQSPEIDYGDFIMALSSNNLSVIGAGRLIALEFRGACDVMLASAQMDVRFQGTGMQ